MHTWCCKREAEIPCYQWTTPAALEVADSSIDGELHLYELRVVKAMTCRAIPSIRLLKVIYDQVHTFGEGKSTWRVRMCGCIARQWLHLAAAPICGRTVLQLQVSLYIGDFGDLYVLIINTGVSNWLLQEWLGWTILLHPQVTNWVLQAVQTNASHYMTDAIWYTQ